MNDIQNPIHPKHGVPVPLTLKCNVTGKITKYTAPEYIKAKVAEAGSLEKLLATYVSKGARGPSTKKPASTASKRGRVWNGKPTEPVEAPSTPSDEKSEPVVTVHHVHTFEDYECNVYFQRQHPEQLLHQSFDHRRKKSA